MIVSFTNCFLRVSVSLTLDFSTAQVNKIVSSTPSKNQQQLPTAASIVATSAMQSQSSIGSCSSTGGTGASQSASSGNNPAVQPNAPTPGQSGIAAAAASTNVVSATIVSSANVQGQSVIQPTPTIAFAAVAKHNTCRGFGCTYLLPLLK